MSTTWPSGTTTRRYAFDPRSAASFAGRATAWHAKREFDKAIADFDLALRLDPKNPHRLPRTRTDPGREEPVHAGHRGFQRGDLAGPAFDRAYDNRGRAWQSKSEFAKAIIDYNMCIAA